MRLIDANELMKLIPSEEMASKYAVANAPTIDAAEVVRCKDCKYLNIINKAPLYAYCGKSNYIFHLFEEDTREHFCSWGERKENEMR